MARIMLSKIYRQLFDICDNLRSKIVILHLKVKYPNISILGTTYIGENCQIICVDSGKMVLDNVHISDGVHLFCQKNADLILNNCFIGRNSILVAVNKIIINDFCEIAEMVTIRDQNHNHNLSNTPIAQQGMNSAPIIIERNVWIGAKATILKGVIIRENSIVGAHSLVNKSVEKGSIYVGIPAKKIKK